MNILFVCAEVAPFVSVGGLSQVMYFLPRALAKYGHTIRIFTPKYGTMETIFPEGRPWKLQMEYEGLRTPIKPDMSDDAMQTDKEDYLVCNVKQYTDKRRNINTYFLENQEYYETRANVFGYMDDHIRFGLLSKGCLEWLLQRKRRIDSQLAIGKDKKPKPIQKTSLEYIKMVSGFKSRAANEDSWWPDIIHCNDWHTAYFIDIARRDQRYKHIFSKTPIVFTVHNFAYQGNNDFRFAPKEEYDDGIKGLAALLSPQLQKQNALCRGLLYADAVNTVSPTHATEVLTPEYAEGLDNTIQKIKGKLIGILNGLDTGEFNPATDPIIKTQYTEKTSIKARRENKADLQKLFLLPKDTTRPLLAFSGRLSSQKGLDILIEIIPHLFAHRPDVQMIVLGGGEDRYRNSLLELQKKYPEQLGVHLQADFRLPRKVFAGSDMFLIPSSYEPGGIVALEALRYGTVPIIRRTGGLNDIIEDFNSEKERGNGFSFVPKDPWALYGSIIEALTIYKNPILWKKLVTNCMMCDFSWQNAAKEYNKWYLHVIEERRRATNPISHPAYSTAG